MFTETTNSMIKEIPTLMVSFNLALVKFILALNLEFPNLQLSYLFTLVDGIILCVGRKNITQIQRAAKSLRHLSSTTKFLNHVPLCVNRMQRWRMNMSLNQIRPSGGTGKRNNLAFLIVDDTCCKMAPSTKKMEALSFQHLMKQASPSGVIVW